MNFFRRKKQRQQNFQQVTAPWRERLYNVALRQTRTSARAEDWVQETFMRAWQDFDDLADPQAVYAWLLKILDHVIADDIRKEARRQQIAPVISTEEIFLQEQHSSYQGPFEQLLQQQNDKQLIKAIQSLPEDFGKVILLRDIEGLSYQQLSRILDVPEGTIMSRLSRGRRLLSNILNRSDRQGSLSQTDKRTKGIYK